MVDLVPGATDVLATSGDSRVTSGTAGATITGGDALYIDSSASNKLKLASTASSTTAACVGIALHAASDTQPLAYITSGEVDMGVAMVKGEVYVLSDTGGGIAPATDNGNGDYVTVVGIGKTTTVGAGLLEVQILASGIAHA